MKAVVVGLLLICVVAACGPEPSREPAPRPLNIAVRQPATLDPPLLRDAPGMLIARQLFGRLVSFDPVTNAIRPGLAARWEVLDGGARFIFHLRKDARFHNGDPLTSEDVRFSLNRLARKDTASEVSFLLDQIVGFEAVNKSGTSSELEGVTAVSPSAIEIRLVAPWMDFPFVLTNISTAPIPRAIFESDPAAFKQRPIGAGPFRLINTFRQGGDLSLTAVNPNLSGGIRRVNFLIYDGPVPAWRDLQQGRVDVAEVPVGETFAAQTKFGSAGFSPAAAGIYLGFNVGQVPDIRLRQAISLAIDRDRMGRAIYDDSLTPATGLIPKNLPGRSESACKDLCNHNLDRAKDLVRQVAPQGQVAIALDYQQGEPQESFAKATQGDLAAAGIVLTPKPAELGVFFDALDRRESQMFRLGWVAEYPLGDWFLTPLFRSDSPDNHTGYGVPEIDEALRAARAEPSRTKRLTRYREIEQRLMEAMVVVPIGQFRNRYAAVPAVQDFYVDAMGGFDVTRLDLAS